MLLGELGADRSLTVNDINRQHSVTALTTTMPPTDTLPSSPYPSSPPLPTTNDPLNLRGNGATLDAELQDHKHDSVSTTTQDTPVSTRDTSRNWSNTYPVAPRQDKGVDTDFWNQVVQGTSLTSLLDYQIDLKIACMTDLWRKWYFVVGTDYKAMATNDPARLARAIQAGIPPHCRGTVWREMSASANPDLEGEFDTYASSSSNPYSHIIGPDVYHGSNHQEDSSFHFTADYSSNPQTQQTQQDLVIKVLQAYSTYDPEVGNVRGMHHIVRTLLLHMAAPQAFSLLVALMWTYNVRAYYLRGQPGLQLAL